MSKEIEKKWKESELLDVLKLSDNNFQLFQPKENQIIEEENVDICKLDSDTLNFHSKILHVIKEHNKTGEDYLTIIKKFGYK